ncbi:MAG: GTP-binding protein, partial [Alphaproteobacteria bacterium]
MTPVSVLTGFLGSGKTTLLAALLRRPEFAGTAVVMNEFGEIGLDHHLIETGDEDMIALSTGCICCAARGDLARAVTDLVARRAAGRIAFERIVIETTGMADPAPIVQGLMLDPALAGTVSLGRVVATVDALAGAETLDDRLEAHARPPSPTGSSSPRATSPAPAPP